MNLSFLKTFKSQNLDFMKVKNNTMCEEEKIPPHGLNLCNCVCSVFFPQFFIKWTTNGYSPPPSGYAAALLDPLVQFKGVGRPELFLDMLFKSHKIISQSSLKQCLKLSLFIQKYQISSFCDKIPRPLHVLFSSDRLSHSYKTIS